MGWNKKNAHTIAVYDLGGGTFDVSILELGEGVYEVSPQMETHTLAEMILTRWSLTILLRSSKRENNVDLRKDPQALQRLREAAEKAKIETFQLNWGRNQSTVYHPRGKWPITFDEWNWLGPRWNKSLMKLIQKTLEPCKKALSDAGKKAADIDEVVFGRRNDNGCQKLLNVVSKFFGKEPNKSVNTDEVVAVGALFRWSIWAARSKTSYSWRYTPDSGIETMGGVTAADFQKYNHSLEQGTNI